MAVCPTCQGLGFFRHPGGFRAECPQGCNEEIESNTVIVKINGRWIARKRTPKEQVDLLDGMYKRSTSSRVKFILSRTFKRILGLR